MTIIDIYNRYPVFEGLVNDLSRGTSPSYMEGVQSVLVQYPRVTRFGRNHPRFEEAIAFGPAQHGFRVLLKADAPLGISAAHHRVNAYSLEGFFRVAIMQAGIEEKATLALLNELIEALTIQQAQHRRLMSAAE